MRAYDPSWRALLLPSAADDFFAGGRPADETALCAELARIAYIGFDRSEAERRRASEILARAGFASVRFFSAGGTECYVARDPKAGLTVVAFRGTAGVRDLLTDLSSWRVRWSAGGNVHAGFAGALQKVWPSLSSELGAGGSSAVNGADGARGERGVGRERIVFTGHSLGAALATLAATLVPAAALCTFGSPRVGDSRFAALMTKIRCVRVTDCADMVCDVPPSWLGFEHAGSHLYLDRDGVRHQDPAPLLVRTDRAAGRSEYLRGYAWRPDNVWSRRLADHAPVNYVTALLSAATT